MKNLKDSELLLIVGGHNDPDCDQDFETGMGWGYKFGQWLVEYLTTPITVPYH